MGKGSFRYRSYYYDTETGFYYLQSRYYDPVVGRFLNSDGIIGANGGIMGYNLFAYCNDHPVMFADPSGELCYSCFQFDNNSLQKIEGSGAAGMALCAALLLAMNARYNMSMASTSIPLSSEELVARARARFEETYGTKAKAEEKEEVITSELPSVTVIYRYYSSKNENLAPRKGKDYDGLSFSTIPPRPGVSAVVTTIEQVNATGILCAISTGGAHIVIVPTNGSVREWMNQGEESIWSSTLSAIVVEWKGC